MALQVWLPLNGTLENKGLSNVTVTNNGATVDNNGKIGKCYNFGNGNASSKGISINNNFVNIGTNRSICAWVRPKGNHYHYSGAIVSSGNWNNSCWAFCLKGDNTGFTGFDRGYNSYYSENIPINTWTHLCVTVEGNVTKFYKNGVYLGEQSRGTAFSSDATNTMIGRETYASGYFSFNGDINDVRIYNHCLSPKEVKEISKGLILHYKLDGNDIGITIPRNGGLISDGVELYDYILSSGTLWIDTNYFADLNKDLEITTESLITSTGRRIVLGNYSGNQNFNLEWNTSNLFRTYLGSDINVTSIGLNTKATAVISWKASSTLLSGNVNGTMFNNVVSSAVKVSTLLFRMFKDTRTTDSLFLQPLRIYKVSIKENGVFVRNWLPCTYLGEPGMWDTVENKFYRNQGTGLFTLGNKITLKEYEYLKTNATSLYINTEISVDSSSSVAYDMIFKYEANGVRRLMGPNTSSLNYFGANSNNKYDKRYTNVSVGNIDHIYEEFNGITRIITSKINGVAYTGSFDTRSGSLLIFALDSGYTGAGQYFYSGKILKNNLVVRDFIPVSYNGTPGLWDKVEWKFYANAGTGSFTLGPEKTVQQNAPIFYDSSGYCNHGTITGTLTTNSDSPRYTQGTVFNGSNSVIKGTLQLSNDYKYTASFWVKPTSFGGTRWIFAVGSGSNHQFGCYLNEYINTLVGGVVGSSATTWSAGLLANTLYHIAITSDGTNVKVYKNGELLGTNVKNGTTTGTTFWIGLRPGSAGTYNYHGILSDFRIYCTALSEDDVKELYNTSAFVTNNGVFAEYELYEDNLSDVKKRGLLETANFYENGAESGYALDTDKTRVASNYIISEEFIEI